MARAIVTAQPASVLGRVVTFSPATVDGDAIAFGRNLLLLIRNDGADPVSVCVQCPRDFQGLPVGDNSFDVAPGTIRVVTLRSAVYARSRDADDPGKVYVDYDQVRGVSRAVIQAV